MKIRYIGHSNRCDVMLEYGKFYELVDIIVGFTCNTLMIKVEDKVVKIEYPIYEMLDFNNKRVRLSDLMKEWELSPEEKESE